MVKIVGLVVGLGTAELLAEEHRTAHCHIVVQLVQSFVAGTAVVIRYLADSTYCLG